MNHTATHMIAPDLEICIDNCTRCHGVCLSTAQYCMEKGSEHASPDDIRLLLDCAEICRTSADFMLRGSDLHGRTCGVCVEVCMRCASECEKMGDDPIMAQCAEVCRQCAESCREMSQSA